jgi:hypothetical protein
LPGEIRQRLVVESVYATQGLVLPDQAGAENQRIVRPQCDGNSGLPECVDRYLRLGKRPQFAHNQKYRIWRSPLFVGLCTR